MDDVMEVHVRNGFANRVGLDDINRIIQVDCLDERTRVAFANAISDSLGYLENDSSNYESMDLITKKILREGYIQLVDNDNIFKNLVITKTLVYSTINKDKYEAVLTIIELFCRAFAIETGIESIFEAFNKIFEAEFVG